MACLVASVADGCIAALIGNMPGLLAVPAQSLRCAFRSKMPWKSTFVAQGFIWTFSGIVTRTLAVLADIPRATPIIPIPPVGSIAVRGALAADPPCWERAPTAAPAFAPAPALAPATAPTLAPTLAPAHAPTPAPAPAPAALGAHSEKLKSL